MNLGILLPLGGSLKDMALHGQDVRFIKYYLKEYCRRFDKVFLFTYEKERHGDLPQNCELICPAVKIHRYFYSMFLAFIKRGEYGKCDVFRCFHLSGALPAILGKIFFGKKFVFNYNYDYKKWAVIERKKHLVPFLILLEKAAFVFSDHVFVSDETMEEYSLRFIKKGKITIIRNGVDPNIFKPYVKGQDTKEQMVLSVGRLEPQKNYELLIKAVSILGIPFKLLIVGRGTQKQELTNLSEKLGVRLEIIDVIPHLKLPEIYNKASLYVQTSLIEAPVKTFLEAMSCGLPCIGTRVAGLREVVDDGKDGLLVDPSPDDLAKGINCLLTDRKKAKSLGQRAREKIIQKYNLLNYVQEEIKILEWL